MTWTLFFQLVMLMAWAALLIGAIASTPKAVKRDDHPLG
jgi:hypothetical protein